MDKAKYKKKDKKKYKNKKKQNRKNRAETGFAAKSQKPHNHRPAAPKKRSNRPTVTGTLHKHERGFGFVTPEGFEEKEKDIFITSKGMHGAMNGDLVEVDLIPQYLWENSPEGIIINIIRHKYTEVAGTFSKAGKFAFVIPDDRKMNDDVYIHKKNFSGAKDGDKVVAEILEYANGKQSAEGRISEIVARKGEPGGDIKILARQHGMRSTFPSRASAEAKAVSSRKIEDADVAGRIDLRNDTIITIDGPDSKDLDDAVSVKILDNGNYLLGVHIADVSHYVAEDGPLDREALKRGNSVYLIDYVVPMLPKSLSNGICSLNPHEDRLTLSVEMEIDKNGQVTDHRIFESIINSTERMVYDDVSDLIEDKDDELKEKYSHILEDIKIMGQLAEILRTRRFGRGSLDFDINEAHIVLNKKGIPSSVDVSERRVANRLIEEFMLKANETVAEHFFWLESPFVYRVHEKPDTGKLEEFRTFLRGLSINMKGSMEDIHPRELNHILEEVKGMDYEHVVNTIMLRTMKKAFYSTDCDGHFGLAMKYYCHFTSPIRRYPDLIIHRIIKEQLRRGMSEDRKKEVLKKAAEAAENSSKTEREAMELERDVEKMKMAEYMQYHIGEEFEGVISGVTEYGMYVELPNTIEGMVRLDSIRDDYYDLEVEKYRLIGRRKHKIYALGQKVTVELTNASPARREIDFELIEE